MVPYSGETWFTSYSPIPKHGLIVNFQKRLSTARYLHYETSYLFHQARIANYSVACKFCCPPTRYNPSIADGMRMGHGTLRKFRTLHQQVQTFPGEQSLVCWDDRIRVFSLFTVARIYRSNQRIQPKWQLTFWGTGSMRRLPTTVRWTSVHRFETECHRIEVSKISVLLKS